MAFDAIDVKQFGAVGDGKTDDALALQRALDEARGPLYLPPGDYLLRQGLQVRLDRRRQTQINSGGARLLNASDQPALHIIGTHRGSASPADLTAAVAGAELMPLVSGLEIVGLNPAGDGIRLEQTYKAVISRVVIRDCHHGIHLVNLNRNVIIADCHLYHNYGVGVLLDEVNLHQTNIHGCHISYNYRGGIKIVRGNVRNVQIVGNDIEYNRDPDDPAAPAGDVWFVAGPIAIREGAITGNTIQGLPTDDGANVRLEGIGPDDWLKVGLLSISGNLISSQRYNVLCRYARGLAIGDNVFFSGHERNVLIEQCEQVTITGGILDHNPDYGKLTPGGIELRQVAGATVTGVVAENCEQALTVTDSREVAVSGCNFRNSRGPAINLSRSRRVSVNGCLFSDEAGTMSEAIRTTDCEEVLTVGNLL